MRYLLSIFAFFTCFTILSCNQASDKSGARGSAATGADVSVQCYKAVFEKDTADMKLSTTAGGKVKGSLVMAYGKTRQNQIEQTVNNGEVQGSFKGDTLYVTYTYTTGTINKTVYTNPLAFLKKGDTLVMGVGDIETQMGRTYFVKGKPIDYEIGRFRFEPVGCKE
jgi:hypothetical protein